jgi:hypothetical protein
MALVPVPGDIATTAETLEGLEVVIPAKRNLFIVLFLTFWLAGWAFGEGAVALQLLRPTESNAPTLFLAAWLGMWTIGGGVAVYTWAWMLFGKERVVLGASSLAIGREVLGLTRRKEYDLMAVNHLQPSALGPTRFGAGTANWFRGIAGGALQFDYGSQTIRFGAALQEAEAKRLASLLVSRRPSLGGARAA